MLNEELRTLRSKLAQRIKKLVRIIPEVTLFYDDTVDEMYRIDDLMKRLNEEGQMGVPSDFE